MTGTIDQQLDATAYSVALRFSDATEVYPVGGRDELGRLVREHMARRVPGGAASPTIQLALSLGETLVGTLEYMADYQPAGASLTAFRVGSDFGATRAIGKSLEQMAEELGFPQQLNLAY